MDAFLKAHCQRYKFATVESNEWAAWFMKYWAEHGVEASVLASIDWQVLMQCI